MYIFLQYHIKIHVLIIYILATGRYFDGPFYDSIGECSGYVLGDPRSEKFRPLSPSST